MDSGLFSGQAEIDISYLDGLEIANNGEAIDEALSRFDWRGQPAGCLLCCSCPG